MTVAEIKEYIDEVLLKMTDRETYFTKAMTKGSLQVIKSMLDELEENNK